MYSQTQVTISKSLIGASLILKTIPQHTDNSFPKQSSTIRNAKLELSGDAKYLDLAIERADIDHFTSKKFFISGESKQSYTINFAVQDHLQEIGKCNFSNVKSTRNSLHFKCETATEANTYTIAPYLPSRDFKKTIYDEIKHQYFFSSESPDKIQYLTRRDKNKQHVFYIDPQIPSELRKMIKDGVLYWNKYFSKKILEVKMAPSGLDPHKLGVNYIRWMNDPETRGLAHNTIDINTGEIIQSSIYLNSDMLHIKMHMGQEFIAHTDDLSIKNKVIRNSLRYIVAHEIGHALGLRHNFAGNLHNHNHSISPSNTVMEYLSVSDRILMGESIREDHYLHEYDSSTIDHLYNNPDQKSINDEPFCTDQDTESKIYIDCRKFDHGSNIAGSFIKSFQERIVSIPLVFYQFSKNQDLDAQESSKLKKETFKLINTIASSLRSTLSLISSPAKALILENTFEEQMSLLREKKIFQILHQYLDRSFLSKKWKGQLQQINATKKNQDKFYEYSQSIMTRIYQQISYALGSHPFFEKYHSSHHMNVFLKDLVEEVINDKSQTFITKLKAISLLKYIDNLPSELNYIRKLQSQVKSHETLPSRNKKMLLNRMESLI